MKLSSLYAEVGNKIEHLFPASIVSGAERSKNMRESEEVSRFCTSGSLAISEGNVRS